MIIQDHSKTSKVSPSAGFSLIELLVAIAIGLVIMAAATSAYKQAMEVSFTIGQRAEMQQNARAAVNEMATDLSRAAIGMPLGGIQLPNGAGTTASKFGCDSVSCNGLTTNTYPGQHLNAITPAPASGANAADGLASDAVSLVYKDNRTAFDAFQLTNMSANGTSITFDPATNPAINNAAVGLKVGDVLVLSNNNGQAVTMVTAVNGATRTATMAAGDWLNLNQPNTANSVASLSNTWPVLPAGFGDYPPTVAYRINVITFVLVRQPDGSNRLMKQVNGLAANPVAENVDDLSITYDNFNDTTGALATNLPNANGTPSLIKKVNISVNCTSRTPDIHGVRLRTTLTTSVNPRSLAFKDRYQ